MVFRVPSPARRPSSSRDVSARTLRCGSHVKRFLKLGRLRLRAAREALRTNLFLAPSLRTCGSRHCWLDRHLLRFCALRSVEVAGGSKSRLLTRARQSSPSPRTFYKVIGTLNMLVDTEHVCLSGRPEVTGARSERAATAGMSLGLNCEELFWQHPIESLLNFTATLSQGRSGELLPARRLEFRELERLRT